MCVSPIWFSICSNHQVPPPPDHYTLQIQQDRFNRIRLIQNAYRRYCHGNLDVRHELYDFSNILQYFTCDGNTPTRLHAVPKNEVTVTALRKYRQDGEKVIGVLPSGWSSNAQAESKTAFIVRETGKDMSLAFSDSHIAAHSQIRSSDSAEIHLDPMFSSTQDVQLRRYFHQSIVVALVLVLVSFLRPTSQLLPLLQFTLSTFLSPHTIHHPYVANTQTRQLLSRGFAILPTPVFQNWSSLLSGYVLESWLTMMPHTALVLPSSRSLSVLLSGCTRYPITFSILKP